MSQEIFAAVHRSADKMGGCDPQWLKDGKAPAFTVTAGGTTGPELILMHGLLGAVSNWDGVFPLFGEFCKPLALEFPILTAHRSEVKVKSLAAYSEYFVRERKLNPVALCGNSLGGHVAMRMYLACPELVSCMVLSGTSGLYEHTVDNLPVRPDRDYIRESMKGVFLNEKFITEERIDEIYKILSNRWNLLNLIHAARSAKKDNLQKLLKEIKVPVLLIWGEDDKVTTMDVAETFHREIKGSKLVTFKNCGHAPMIEYPERFAEEVKNFLSANQILR